MSEGGAFFSSCTKKGKNITASCVICSPEAAVPSESCLELYTGKSHHSVLKRSGLEGTIRIIKLTFFTQRVQRDWHGMPREAVGALFLEVSRLSRMAPD